MARGRTWRRSTSPTVRGWPGSCAGSEPAKPGSVWPRSTQLEVFTGGLSQAQEVWKELQPFLARVGRLEELVGWWRPVQP